jgi:carboxyl-terminal processing protease
VVLTIARYGETEPLDFELRRDNITVEDITYADFIGEDIAYIRLTRFSRNSASDMKKSLQNLSDQGMEKLIIDLRGNPGGLLEAAIDILELLIPEGHDLLFTRGRYDEASKEFRSGRSPIISEDLSLVILIDGGSASASEIISGAVQDLDRGIIIGTPSFGKGLVQSVFPIDKENSIKITTAKYYIPSGRFIQKPGYLEEEIDIGPEHDSTKVFNTVGGREVTELGGITPDIEVEMSSTLVLARECWRRGLFFKYASLYMQNHELVLPVIVDDEILEDFRGFLSSKELTLNLEGEKQFRTLLTSIDSTAAAAPIMKSSLETIEHYYDDLKAERFDIERDGLILGLEREFSFQLGGTEARIASSFDDDPIILKAIDVLSDQITYDSVLTPSEY